MIPQNDETLREDFTFENLPSKTFKLYPETQTITGAVDEVEAVEQAIYLMLNTERYAWIIHSWDYGTEFADLIGKDPDYCIPEIERRIPDALLQDDRIQKVQNFEFDRKGKVIHVTFDVVTIYGSIKTEMEVDI